MPLMKLGDLSNPVPKNLSQTIEDRILAARRFLIIQGMLSDAEAIRIMGRLQKRRKAEEAGKDWGPIC